jgi:hypothetical protein
MLVLMKLKVKNSLFVPIAQRIERSPAKAEMKVQFLLGTQI